MNPLNSDHHGAAAAAARPLDDAFVLVHGAAVMPDVVVAAPTSSESYQRAASSQCHVCQVTRRHDTNNSSSSAAAAAAAAGDYHVTYASSDNARQARVNQAGVNGPLPDLVNVHRPAASSSSPYEYDRPCTSASLVYHAANVNHYMPAAQPATSATGSHSPCTHRSVRGIYAIMLLAS